MRIARLSSARDYKVPEICEDDQEFNIGAECDIECDIEHDIEYDIEYDIDWRSCEENLEE